MIHVRSSVYRTDPNVHASRATVQVLGLSETLPIVYEFQDAYARLPPAPEGGGTQVCYETEVQCNGVLFIVTTCCFTGEPTEDCIRRHLYKVEHACDA